MDSGMVVSTRDLGIHKNCGGTIVEMEIERSVLVCDGNCICDDPDCWDTHSVWEDRSGYYIGCPGCNAIRSVSIHPYSSNECYFVLPIEGEAEYDTVA